LDPTIDLSIYEKKETPGANIICGQAISAFMLRGLRLEVPPWCVAANIERVVIHAPNEKFWALSSNQQIYGYVLWRGEYEQWLASMVMREGGKFHFGHEIKGFDEPEGFVVAADGLTGTCRKHLGLSMPNMEDVHIGVQKIAKLPYPNNRLDLYFGSEFAPKGYAWIFTTGMQNRVRIGLGVPLSERVNPSKLLKKFSDYAGAEPITPLQAKLIPTARPPEKLVYGNFLLVGDSGLFCDAATGGGIANAIESGQHAARAIVKSFRERTNPLKYYSKLCGPLRRRNNYRYRLKGVLNSLSDEDFNDLITSVQNFHPQLTRVSWAFAQALLRLTLKKPKLVTSHRILRRLFD